MARISGLFPHYTFIACPTMDMGLLQWRMTRVTRGRRACLGSHVLVSTVSALLLLGALNLVGVRASARVNAVFATIAALSQLMVVLAVIVHVGPGQLMADLPRVLKGPHLTPARLLTGYAGAFLAFSGLESISQLSPAIAEPRRRVVAQAMRMLVATMVLTSPFLTLWSTTVLPITPHTDPNQFISLLAGYAAGRGVEIEVAVIGNCPAHLST